MSKIFKTSLIALLAFFGSFGSSFAKDITLSMWTHNQLYVDYFNTYLDEVQAAFPDDNISFDFQVTPDMATNSLTAIASGSEHTDLLGIEISGFGLFMADDIISDNFVPLNDMYGDMSQWNPGKVAAWTHTDGNIYGIESEGCYMVYYYNPSILEGYDLSVPVTWAEFMETGKILAKDGISMMLSELRFIGMYQQAGGKFFNEDGDFEMNEDLFMDILKYQEEAFASGVINYTTDYWGQTPGVLYNSKQTARILKLLNKQSKVIISIFAGRAGDTGKDPIPEFKKSITMAKNYKNVEILWASVREPYNYLQAKSLGCHIITIPPETIEKIENFGKTFNQLTLETVKAFLVDSKKSNFKI